MSVTYFIITVPNFEYFMEAHDSSFMQYYTAIDIDSGVVRTFSKKYLDAHYKDKSVTGDDDFRVFAKYSDTWREYIPLTEDSERFTVVPPKTPCLIKTKDNQYINVWVKYNLGYTVVDYEFIDNLDVVSACPAPFISQPINLSRGIKAINFIFKRCHNRAVACGLNTYPQIEVYSRGVQICQLPEDVIMSIPVGFLYLKSGAYVFDFDANCATSVFDTLLVAVRRIMPTCSLAYVPFLYVCVPDFMLPVALSDEEASKSVTLVFGVNVYRFDVFSVVGERLRNRSVNSASDFRVRIRGEASKKRLKDTHAMYDYPFIIFE